MNNPYKLYRQFKLGNLHTSKKSAIWFRAILPLIGLLALIWFLIRVIPKPSRATYPCQRIAFPIASGFILWLMGILSSLFFLRRARNHFARSKYYMAASCACVCVICLWITLSITSSESVKAADPVPNNPIGVAKGIFPGRVVWIHDPNSTDWDGPGVTGDYFWQPEHTSQKHADAMVSRAVRELTGQEFDYQAWDQLFIYFNENRGKGSVGYTPGEKITIKINLTTCNAAYNWVDPVTYEKLSYRDRTDTTPQLVLSVLRQLVHTVGVDPNCIAVGDTLARFPSEWHNLLFTEFPGVVYFDRYGGQDRTASTNSEIVQHWSHGLDPNDYTTDYIPTLYAEAEYLINIPVLKSHGAGITLTAKNHYGSYNRRPDDSGYYNLHDSLGGTNPSDAQYRALVDIMGHPHMGGKTLLYILDGLYGGDNWSSTPYKFQMDPFNDDWPSSIFVSQDPVAIDCVGLDILWSEGWDRVRNTGGLDDYLYEAAQADNPPSGTFYDPDGDGTRLESLGVYERWNNPIDRQYSRNLGTVNGIELRYIKIKHFPGDLNHDEEVDILDLIKLINQWLWMGEPGGIFEDYVEDGVVNMKDFSVISENWEYSDQ